MLRLAAPLSLLISISANSSPGQTCSQTVIANALGTNGLPIKSLETGDFKAVHRGKPLAVLASGFRSDPSVRITILLDTSASMAFDGGRESIKWKIARDAVIDFVSSAPAQARVSLLTFSSKIVRRFDSADGRAPIENWLQSGDVRRASEVKGMTALYATISEALAGLKPAYPGDAIYVVTDGGDTEGKESVSNVIRELQDTGVRLFALLLNDSLGNHPSARDLYNLAKASGGLTFVVNPFTAGTGWAGSGFHDQYEYNEEKARAVEADARWALAAITHFYVLVVNGVEGLSRPDDWELGLDGPYADRRKEITLTYPNKLGGCIAQSARK